MQMTELYVDYINSWGPAIVGHAHDEVVEAVKLQAEKGFSFGAPTELETEIAKFIIENVPNIDQIRMVSSGNGSLYERNSFSKRLHRKRKNHKI